MSRSAARERVSSSTRSLLAYTRDARPIPGCVSRGLGGGRLSTGHLLGGRGFCWALVAPYAGVVAKVRLGRGVLVVPDVWRDAIVEELELAGDMVSFEAARRLRGQAGGRGRGVRLSSTSGEFKRAVLRAVERAKVGFDGAPPAEILRFEGELRRDLGLSHVD